MSNILRDRSKHGAHHAWEAVPEALRDSIRCHARNGLNQTSMLLGMARHLLISRLRVDISWSTPTAPEVIANYARGLVLFGRPGARRAIFEWHSFPSRAVITRETAKIPRALRPVRRRGELETRIDQDFESIVDSCRAGRTDWPWITPALIGVYREVQELGFVRTVGTYRDGELVGGLWGIEVGRVLGIMSMFHRENNGGSLALGTLVDSVINGGRWSIVDCGEMKPHFDQFGAREISQQRFCELVCENLK
jgi:leucyl/phenylalanyl-tRNA--protein transferase